jgi:lipoprotein-anchoring transpeptidase ErfK/SrfK
MPRVWSIGVAVLALAAAGGGSAHARSHAPSPALSAAAVDQAACADAAPRMTRAATLKAEVLMDRLGISPGVIDGRTGENVTKALAAFQRSRGLAASGRVDRATWDKLCETAAGAPVLTAYTITDGDVRGPFVADMPRGLEAMSHLEQLGYHDASELLAEKFHTSEELIHALNSGMPMDRAGTVITVPNVASGRPAGTVVRIEVDKPGNAVRAFGRHDEVVAFYPASVGSAEKPAPSGTLYVRRIAHDPTYRYDPKFQFKGVRTDKELVIAPGPNNPVGVVWIELSKESYGIHGTSRPENVGKTQSHGCVRLTNWDALDLARRIHRGTPVAFLDQTPAAER